MPEFKVCPLLSLLPPARVLQHLLVNFSKFYIQVRFFRGGGCLAWAQDLSCIAIIVPCATLIGRLPRCLSDVLVPLG